ncbi:palmitoyltransferase ZDHHC15A [Alosa pseudoharengus]|uniref:palmitoyltransferase ZDHHC15A n=1 Tax=Alosa pseudoharengus TaxID=34774 RepID=UPI003F8B3662
MCCRRYYTKTCLVMALRATFRRCVSVLSWIPVIILTMVVVWSYYAYVVQLCLITLTGTARKVMHLLMFHVCFGMFSWAFWRSVFTTPSSPLREFQLSLSDRQRYAEQETPEAKRRVLLEISQKLPVHSRSASGGVYSKWITTVHGRLNNCVGFSNYKFFLLLLAFSLLYCLFIVATVAPYFVKFWLGPFLNHSTVKVHVLFLMVVSLVFAITLSFLLGFHCWLVIKNKTTVEWLSAPFFSYGPDRRAFDVGLKPNVLQVFGSQRRFWLLPVFSSHGDGQVFPLRRKLLLPYTHGVQLNEYWEEAESKSKSKSKN